MAAREILDNLCLQEIFNTKGPTLKYGRRDGMTAYTAPFDVKGKKYETRIYMDRTAKGDDYGQIYFSLDDGTAAPSYHVTNTGDSATVMSRVLSSVSKFVKKHQPTLLHFEAHEPSRRKLYDRLVRTFFARLDYQRVTPEEARQVLGFQLNDGDYWLQWVPENPWGVAESLLQEDISLRRARVKRCLATIIRLPGYLRGIRGKDNARVPLARFQRCAKELDATLQSFQNKPSVEFDARLAEMAKYIVEYYMWASAYLRARKVRMRDLQVWRQFETDTGQIMGMVTEAMRNGTGFWVDPAGAVHATGDDIHAQWALDNVLDHWYDDEEKDTGDVQDIIDTMLNDYGYARIVSEGNQLWVEAKRLSQAQRSSIKNFAIEQGMEAVLSRTQRPL